MSDDGLWLNTKPEPATGAWGKDLLWNGLEPRVCGEHRTTGPRAWCYEDHTWCYPHDPCPGCTTEEQRIADAIDLLRDNDYYVQKYPGADE